MRMWMVDPSLMCRQHLLGEHVEAHMLVGSLRRGHSVDGFLERGLLEPQHAASRHDVLAAEMVSRGYSHSSPLEAVQGAPVGTVDVNESLRELARRCEDCRVRIGAETGGNNGEG